MEQLIKYQFNDDRITLSARELHDFLEVSSKFNDWFSRMQSFGFNENADYVAIAQKKVTAQGNGSVFTDYQITVDMAKEIAMLQRNEKGKEARTYFIQLEKEWNSPERIMSRALMIAQKELQSIRVELQELKPKAEYYDSILKNKGLITVTAISKDYGMSATEFNNKLHELGVQFKQSGQWFLYGKYQKEGYTHSETVNIVRADGRPDIKMNTKWTQKGRIFLYTILKDNEIVPLIELN